MRYCNWPVLQLHCTASNLPLWRLQQTMHCGVDAVLWRLQIADLRYESDLTACWQSIYMVRCIEDQER